MVGATVPARMVRVMLLISLLGALFGVAVSFATYHQGDGMFDRLAGVLVETVERLLVPLAERAGRVPGCGHVAVVLVSLLAVLTPGICVLCLAVLARAAHAVRVRAARVLFVAGGCSFLWLPGGDAWLLLAVCLLAGAVLSLTDGVVFGFLLAATAAVLGVKFGMSVWNGHGAGVDDALTVLAALLPRSGDAIRPLLTVVGLCPFALAVQYHLRLR